MTITSAHASRFIGVLLVIAALIGCRKTQPQRHEVGVLTSADGPVERAQGNTFVAIAAGTKLYPGDRLRTAAGVATITLADGSRLEIRPQSEVDLTTRSGMLDLEVGRGAVLLSGTGTYALEMGQVSLVGGTLAVTSRGEHAAAVELVIGRGSLVEEGGKRWDLEMGKILTLEVGQIALLPSIDAGVPDAASASADASALVVVEVDGDGARVQDSRGHWSPVKRGTTVLSAGTKLATGATTTAVVKVRGTTVELAGGARLAVTADLALVLERGAASANLAATDDVALHLPGGDLSRPPNRTADIRVEVDARGDASVVVALGSAKLAGKRSSSDLELSPGDAAIVRATGMIVAGDVVIPDHFDLAITPGQPAMQTLHDASGMPALRFDVAGACSEGGVIELDRDASFRLPHVSYGERAANLLVRTGDWRYRVRCVHAGVLGAAVASGRLAVVRDAGTRPLPKAPPHFAIDADGRNYELHYQSQIPDVDVHVSGSGASFTLHLESGGAEKTFTSTTGTFRIPSNVLREREYKFWVVRDGSKSKVSTLKISFDQTAAQVYIESPVDGRAWGSQIEVRGATLPGWTASVDSVAIPSDPQSRRFRTAVPTPPEARAIGIRLEHPEHGVHIYVRRGTSAGKPR